MDETGRETQRAGGAPARANARAWGFRVGSIRGIEVRVDWSLAVIFVLIAANLGAGFFPARHPTWSPASWWAMALVAALAFFASVLAHELAHAIVGRRQGVAVEGITLFMFGGVSRMAKEPASPRAEFLMTIVGPLTSLAIGIVATAGGLVLARSAGAFVGDDALGSFARLGPIATLLLWLGPVNLLLALFNLLPGFPLDGGRVLRAALWRATGNLEKATRWSSYVGRALALALVFAGFAMLFGGRVPLLGSGFAQGLWLVLIGWFLHSAAAQSHAQVVVSGLLRDIRVENLMRGEVNGIAPDATVLELADRLVLASDQRCLPVLGAERFEGLVCLADLRRLPRATWGEHHVRDIMTPVEALATVSPRDEVTVALAKLASRDVDQVPVVEQGRLRGLLRRSDVLRWIELQRA